MVVFAWVCLLPITAQAQTSQATPSPDSGPAANTASPSWNTTVDESGADATRRQLEDQQRALELSRQQEGRLESVIEQLAREKSQLTEHLVETAKRVQASENDLSTTEAKLAELAEKQKTIQTSLATQKAVLVKLLAALQRMGRDPPPILATEREDALKMVRSAMQLAAVFPQLKDKAAALSKDLTELDQTVAGIRSESAARIAEKQKLVDEQTRLDALLAQKHAELADKQGDLDKLREVVGNQAKSVAGLGELIAKADHAVALKGTLGESDKDLQEAAPLPEPQPETLVAAAESPPSSKAKLDQATAAVGSAQPGHNFEKARGSLPVPVQGKRILRFGDPSKNVGRSRGEVFQTRANAQITSPCDGLVVYSGEFRTFGQLLIINAGGGYHVLLAGLGQLDVVAGQAIVAGEPIGKMGEGLADVGGEASAPILYVEFRSRDKPINPGPWWAGEAEKVQG
jgi:septal ring factor EnvC (AmiA/AmiB activator)